MLPNTYRFIEGSTAELTEVGRSTGVGAAVGLDNKRIVPEYMTELMGKDCQHSHRDGIGLYKFVCWRFVARLTPIQQSLKSALFELGQHRSMPVNPFLP